jgi:hypothetical protein
MPMRWRRCGGAWRGSCPQQKGAALDEVLWAFADVIEGEDQGSDVA